jgi:hypothetical protein
LGDLTASKPAFFPRLRTASGVPYLFAGVDFGDIFGDLGSGFGGGFFDRFLGRRRRVVS